MSKRLYVGNLPRSIDRTDLDGIFSKFGEIIEISIKDKEAGPVYAFVEYKNDDDADNAQNTLNNMIYRGYTMRVEYTRGIKYPSKKDMVRRGPPKRTDYRVEITHLPPNCSWQDLKDYMTTIGPVGYCNIRGDYGVVEFLHYDDMKRAVRKLNDTKLKSRDGSSYIHVHNRYRSHHHHHHRHHRHHSDSYSDSGSSRSRSRSRSKDDKKSKSRSTSKSQSRSNSKSQSRSASRSKDRNSRSRSNSKDSRSE